MKDISAFFLESVIASHPKTTEAITKNAISNVLKNAPFQEGGVQKRKKDEQKQDHQNENIEQLNNESTD